MIENRVLLKPRGPIMWGSNHFLTQYFALIFIFDRGSRALKEKTGKSLVILLLIPATNVKEMRALMI